MNMTRNSKQVDVPLTTSPEHKNKVPFVIQVKTATSQAHIYMSHSLLQSQKAEGDQTWECHRLS